MYVLEPSTQDAAGQVVRPWEDRVLYVSHVSAFAAHSPECMLAEPVRPPVLPLHPDVQKQVLRLLALRVPPAEILADNVRLIRDSHCNKPVTDEYRLYLENQVCLERGVVLSHRAITKMSINAGYCQHPAPELEVRV